MKDRLDVEHNGVRCPFHEHTIELKETPTGEQWAAYGWSVYPPSSVLAGQDMKVFLEYFDTEEEARIRYPDAQLGFRSANNYVGHLPDGPDNWDW